jgi:hypothetical protein
LLYFVRVIIVLTIQVKRDEVLIVKEVIMFRGTLAAKVPDEWISDPSTVKFAHGERHGRSTQLIDFTANGGKAVEFWTLNDGQISCHWRYLTPDEIAQATWVNRPKYVEPYSTAKMFGHTNKWITLG